MVEVGDRPAPTALPLPKGFLAHGPGGCWRWSMEGPCRPKVRPGGGAVARFRRPRHLEPDSSVISIALTGLEVRIEPVPMAADCAGGHPPPPRARTNRATGVEMRPHQPFRWAAHPYDMVKSADPP